VVNYQRLRSAATTPDLLTTAWRFHQVGDFLRAEQTYRQLVELEPGNSQAWYLLGALYQSRGDLAAAGLSFLRVLKPDLDFRHPRSLTRNRTADGSVPSPTTACRCR
jgi:Flp pilus assembly protein TadD